MKKLFIVTLLFLALTSCKNESLIGTNNITYKVFYFHPTARCESCINIENFTRELVLSKYGNPLPVKYESLNIEDKENEHFRKEFNLKFSSVVIVKYKKGEVERFRNLDSIWTYSDNKFKFVSYADKEFNSFLNEN